MAKFKVGDIIKGKALNGYAITNEHMTRAEVISAPRGESRMRIKVQQHLYAGEVGFKYDVLNTTDRFTLVEKAKKATKTWDDKRAYSVSIIRAAGSDATRAIVKVDGKSFVGTAKCSKEDEFDFAAGAELALHRAVEGLAKYEKAKAEEAEVPRNGRGVKIGDLVKITALVGPFTGGLKAGDLAEVIGLGGDDRVYVACKEKTAYNGDRCLVPGQHTLKQPFTYLNPNEYTTLDRQPFRAKQEGTA